jgi:GNAT superfamily N-acetyltransferase
MAWHMDVVHEVSEDKPVPVARWVESMRRLNAIEEPLARRLLALHRDCGSGSGVCDGRGRMISCATSARMGHRPRRPRADRVDRRRPRRPLRGAHAGQPWVPLGELRPRHRPVRRRRCRAVGAHLRRRASGRHVDRGRPRRATSGFGAFAGERLVAELGIARCGGMARYQDVGTDAAHRRRGLARHLLGVAAPEQAARGTAGMTMVACSATGVVLLPFRAPIRSASARY